MSEKNFSSGRAIIGTLLIGLGSLLILKQYNLLHPIIADNIISWPMLLIVIGVINIIHLEHKLFGLIVTSVGVVFLLNRINENWFSSDILWPVIFIFFGLFLLFKRSHYHRHWKHFKSRENAPDEINKDKIDVLALFGGGEKIVTSQNFQGGTITTIFGGYKIDLTGCKLAAGENIIDIVAVFGGVEIIAPRSWKIRTDIIPIFGGFANKYHRDPNMVLDPNAELVIKGNVIFGGGELKLR